jgi:hypothetical protein
VARPWKECSVVEERLRFVARLLDGEAMTERPGKRAKLPVQFKWRGGRVA